MSDLTERKPLSAMPREREDMAAWIQVVELFRQHGMPEPPVRLRDEIVHFMMWGWYGQEAADVIDRLTRELAEAKSQLERYRLTNTEENDLNILAHEIDAAARALKEKP